MTEPTRYAAAAPERHPRIEGVKVKPLKLIPDERGYLMEILRADDTELFTRFGQVYLSANAAIGEVSHTAALNSPSNPGFSFARLRIRAQTGPDSTHVSPRATLIG